MGNYQSRRAIRYNGRIAVIQTRFHEVTIIQGVFVMPDKELLLTALKGGHTSRPAWVPFVGVHGGKLLDITATEYLKSSARIVQGLKKAFELYGPDGLPIVFDLQLEAEVLGCKLVWADEVPPSVVSHPLMGEGRIEDLPAFSVDKGRFPVVREAMQTLVADLGKQIGLYGLITGPFTLTSHLLGSQVFLDMLMSPERTKEIMAFATEIAKKTASFYLEHGCPIVAVVDPMTSQISAAHFEEFVSPYLNALFSHIQTQGGLSSLFVCGDATRNLEVMCRTSCDNISVDENIPLELLCTLAKKHGKSAGGNMRLTTVLLLGKPADAMLDAIRCIDVGGNQGFVLAPGCDLPYDTPVANLQAAAAMVHDDYQRQVARMTVTVTDMGPFDDIKIPDFRAEKSVILDVITLDSTGCAPCLYMLDAAIRAAEKAGVPVDVREHKIKSREGIGYMTRMGVKNIPTVCIDGEVKFISQIPDSETFIQAIRDRAKTLGKL
jgi:MtaA/CmuA family methyltransferase